MIRVLHTIPAMDGGGADRILYDYSTRIMESVHFDFIVHTEEEGILESDLVKRGCNVYHVPPLHKSFKEYLSKVESIIKNGKYDIIHVAQGYRGLFYLYFAKKYGVKVRIAHSHMAGIPENTKQKLVRKVCTFFVKQFATHLFACGKDAAIWMWGNKSWENGDVYIMTNAINTSGFVFSEEKRKQLRATFGLEDKIVIGNVARFSYQKNHEFIIKIFSEVKKQIPNAMLMLVGRGELEEQVRDQIKQLQLEDSVLMTGVRNDVPDLLNAMDLFLLPSRFEGLPVTLVEAQTNGLPIFASSAITKEIKIAENMVYMSLDESPCAWADCICSFDLKRISNSISGSGYDIDKAAVLLMEKYSLLLSETE